MGFLVTTARVKRALGIPSAVTEHDTLLGELCEDVDAVFAGEVGVPALSRADYTETLDIPDRGTRSLRLKAWPVASVAGVTDDGSVIAAADRYLQDDYVYLKDSGAYFTVGWQTVEVAYTAGLTYTDSLYRTLQAGAISQVAAWFNRHPRAGLSGVSTGRSREDLAQGDLTPEARRAIGSMARIF